MCYEQERNDFIYYAIDAESAYYRNTSYLNFKKKGKKVVDCKLGLGKKQKKIRIFFIYKILINKSRIHILKSALKCLIYKFFQKNKLMKILFKNELKKTLGGVFNFFWGFLG